MKSLSWLITLPILVVVVVFAVNNRGAVDFDLWPVGLTVAMPLYLTVLGTIVVGFIAGGSVVWIASAQLRRTVRRQRHRVSELERQVKKFEAADDDDKAVPPKRPKAARNGTALSLPGA